MTAEKGESPWIWVGVGCLVSLIVGVVAAVSLGVFGYRKAKELQAEIRDPAKRTARAHEVLGCDELPNGYYAAMSVSVPFLMDMAILSDRPPEAEGRMRGFGRRGFIYFKSLRMGRDRNELKDYFEGKTNDPEVLRRNRIRIDVREVLKRGVLPMKGQSILYVVERGDLRMAGDRSTGLTTLMLVECPSDQRQRLGIWFGPDPSPARPAGDVDYSGTPGDDAAIREFMSHFRLCGA